MELFTESIPAGASLVEFMSAFQLRHSLDENTSARAWGRLLNATVSRGPHGPSIVVSEQAYLVGCDVSFDDDGFTALGTVSWRDGLVAGEVTAAVSAGITVTVHRHPSATSSVPTASPQAGGWSAAVSASTEPDMPNQPSTASDGTASGWGMAVASSTATEQPSGPLDAEQAMNLVRRGDVILHPAFGECTVVKPGQGGKIKIRRPVGGFLDLALRVFTIHRESDRENRRVFSLTLKRK